MNTSQTQSKIKIIKDTFQYRFDIDNLPNIFMLYSILQSADTSSRTNIPIVFVTGTPLHSEFNVLFKVPENNFVVLKGKIPKLSQA